MSNLDRILKKYSVVCARMEIYIEWIDALTRVCVCDGWGMVRNVYFLVLKRDLKKF